MPVFFLAFFGLIFLIVFAFFLFIRYGLGDPVISIDLSPIVKRTRLKKVFLQHHLAFRKKAEFHLPWFQIQKRTIFLSTWRIRYRLYAVTWQILILDKKWLA